MMKPMRLLCSFFSGPLDRQRHPVAARSRAPGYSQLGRLDVFGRALYGVAVFRGELGDELEQGGALVFHGFTVAAEQGLVLRRQDVDPCLQVGETVSDVMHQQPDIMEVKGQRVLFSCRYGIGICKAEHLLSL